MFTNSSSVSMWRSSRLTPNVHFWSDEWQSGQSGHPDALTHDLWNVCRQSNMVTPSL